MNTYFKFFKLAKILIIRLLFINFFILISCNIFNKNTENVLNIPLRQDNNTNLSKIPDSIPIVKVVVSSMLSPKETQLFYQELFTYMSKSLGYKIEFIQRKTYKEVNDLLIHNNVDLAIICSGAYVETSVKNKIEILCVPVISNKPFYNSYIIVNKEHKFNNIEDLEHKKFAYTDPLSNSGTLYAKWLIKKLGKDTNTFFSKTVYTYGHDISMQLVAKGIVDGASVDALIYNYYKKFYPEKIKYLKIINQSSDFGIPPLVIPINLNSDIKFKIQKFFLNIHKDTLGIKILNKLLIDKFILGNDKNYNSIRKMKIDLAQ